MSGKKGTFTNTKRRVQRLFKAVEAPDLSFLNDVTIPKNAIALAMKREQQVVEFYKNLSETARDSQLKDLFQNLANMELDYKHRLETVFVAIGYPVVF